VLPIRELRAKSRPTATYEAWPMLKLAGWIATAFVAGCVFWQLGAAEPLLPRIASGLILAVVSLLAGLRIGTDSCHSYIKDLQRNNKVLAEQQRDLEEMNEMLLKQINSASPAHSRSAVDSGHVLRPK
jgi:hypothetical protein